MNPLLLLLLAPPLAPPAPGPPQSDEPPPRPAYRFLRWQEDWSVLAGGPLADPDPFDAIKHVPLDDDGDVWASFGGHARVRLEGWNDFAFGAPSDADDAFVLWRLLLHGDLHVGERLRLFVEGKSALASDRELPGGKRPLDEDQLDLQQAFVDLTLDAGGGELTLRPGRQELLFGRQRLVSPLPWGNTLRTWQGVSARYATDDWNATAFATRFVPVDGNRFNDADEDEPFSGVYATASDLPGGLGLDLYWLHRERDAVTYNGTTGDEERHTFGARAFARHGDLDWDFEVAAQRGDVGAGDVSAEMAGAQVGLRLGDPRVYVGLDYGSGDDAAGGDVETFDQLYPLGHAWLGQADVIGRQNVVDANAGVTFPVAGWQAGIEGHAFRAADTDDAIYNPGGGVVRAGGSYTSKEIGFEADVRAKRSFGRHLVVSFGYSRFFAGDAIEESGSADDVDFGFVAAQYTF